MLYYNKIYTKKYEQNSWNTVGETSVSNTNNVLKANMLEMNNELYLIISEWEKLFYINSKTAIGNKLRHFLTQMD